MTMIEANQEQDQELCSRFFSDLLYLSKDLYSRRGAELLHIYDGMFDGREDCLAILMDSGFPPPHYDMPPLTLATVSKYMVHREARFLLDCGTDAHEESAELDRLWQALHKKVVSRKLKPGYLVDIMRANQDARRKIMRCHAHAYGALTEIMYLLHAGDFGSLGVLEANHAAAQERCALEVDYIKRSFDEIVINIYPVRISMPK